MSFEPRVGLSTDFNSNPDLRVSDERSETHGALLLDIPLAYDRDEFHASLRSNARVSDARGYSSLASNFFHVDAGARYLSDLSSTALTAGWARDTSLYHGGEADRGVGVRRETRSAGLDWQRSVTERSQIGLDLGWSKVAYDHNTDLSGLADYRYLSAAPSISYDLSERNSMSLSISAGSYRAVLLTSRLNLTLVETTTSKSYDAQLTFKRVLDEVWDVSSSFGYSKAKNNVNFVVGPFGLGSLDSNQRSTIYSAILKRHGESLSFTASVSRALRPSGSSFLSRYDSADAMLNYAYSERWNFTGRVSWNKTLDTQTNRSSLMRRYLTSELSASWQYKPDWFLVMRTSRVSQHYDQAAFNADSNGATLEITHQFDRTDL